MAGSILFCHGMCQVGLFFTSVSRRRRRRRRRRRHRRIIVVVVVVTVAVAIVSVGGAGSRTLWLYYVLTILCPHLRIPLNRDSAHVHGGLVCNSQARQRLQVASIRQLVAV